MCGTRLFSFVLCVMLEMFVGLQAAQAWAPEGFADGWEDLPQAVQTLLPAEETLVNGFYNAQTYYVLMEGTDGVRTVYVLQPVGGGYAIDLQSAPLPPIDGVSASIGSTGRDYLYLFYGDGSFNFGRQADGVWLFRSVQMQEMFAISPDFGVTLYEEDGTEYLPGRMPAYNLASLDPRDLPNTTAKGIALLDDDGYALVTSDVPTDRLNLRTASSRDAESIGKYYSGTPVQVLSTQGGWAKVDIFGVQGYMDMDFLAFGDDMRVVNRWFPDLYPYEKNLAEGVNVYLRPEESPGLYVGTIGGDTTWSLPTVTILANAGPEWGWFHVVCENGLTGYAWSPQFWPGNG